MELYNTVFLNDLNNKIMFDNYIFRLRNEIILPLEKQIEGILDAISRLDDRVKSLEKVEERVYGKIKYEAEKIKSDLKN